MAQQVNVKFVDDLDGSDAASTVSFALDGRAYEVDLSVDNAAKLRDSLALFVAAARKSGGSAATAAAGHRRRPPALVPNRSRSTATKPQRSGHGLAGTARSPTAAESPRRWSTPSRPPTEQATRGGRSVCSGLPSRSPMD